MEKISKELEVITKQGTNFATTITMDDIYGSLNQKDAEEILKKINSNIKFNLSGEESVLEAYKLMNKRDTLYINIAHVPDGYTIFADEVSHVLGELVLRKKLGLVTRVYDSDFGHPFEIKLTATHLKIFGLKYDEIISKINNWNETSEHEKDYVTGSGSSIAVLLK